MEIDRSDLLQSPVQTELGNVTTLEALRRALNGHAKCAVEAKGVVLIRPARDVPGTWLDYKIREFSRARTDIQTASNVLLMSLRQQVQPRRGFAGHFVPGRPDDLVGPFDEKGKTVRELLNLIVGSSKGAMWISVGPYNRTSAAPDAFWTILEYSGGGPDAAIYSLEQRVISGFAPKTPAARAPDDKSPAAGLRNPAAARYRASAGA